MVGNPLLKSLRSGRPPKWCSRQWLRLAALSRLCLVGSMHINPTRVGDIVLGIVFRVHYQTVVIDMYIRCCRRSNMYKR